MGKEYFAKLNQKSGARAGFFWPPLAARKKITGAGVAWKKIGSRMRSRLKKSQEPQPLKN